MMMVIVEEDGVIVQLACTLNGSTISGYLNSVSILIPRLTFGSVLLRVSSIPFPTGSPESLNMLLIRSYALRPPQSTFSFCLPISYNFLTIRGLSELQRSTPQPSSSAKDDYYSLLLSSPLPPSVPPSTSSKAPGLRAAVQRTPSTPSTPPVANIVFGSRITSPAAARAQKGWAEARPAEPDNCCMSGCVNCVWDLFREEVEEWAARQKQAHRSEVARESKKARDMRGRGMRGSRESKGAGDVHGADGGYEGVDLAQEGLFDNLPVGIMEFMNTEKRLRERKQAEKG